MLLLDLCPFRLRLRLPADPLLPFLSLPSLRRLRI